MDDIATYARIGATLAALFILVCRLNAMDAATPRAVAWQHEGLACALVLSLVLPRDAAAALLAAAVAGFLAASSRRWRGGPPYLHDGGAP